MIRNWTLPHPGGVSEIRWAPGLVRDPHPLAALLPPASRLFLISDENVMAAWGRPLVDRLRALGREVTAIELPLGEERKTLATVTLGLDQLLAGDVRRDDRVLSLGGGVLGDEAGLIAALALRGLEYHQIPTTLLAMVDSAIGGKVGVDHVSGKNRIGAFHFPAGVWIDVELLDTLPERERRAGLFEVVKAAWLSGPDAVAGLDLSGHGPGLAAAIAMAVACKVDVVRRDPGEGGERRVLNLGHTFAHALEAATDYRRFLHGEAVAWGLVAAARLSQVEVGLAASEVRRLEAMVEAVGPIPSIEDLAFDALEPFFAADKKATRAGLAWVLLEAAGRPRISNSIALAEAARVWESLRAEASARSRLSPVT